MVSKKLDLIFLLIVAIASLFLFSNLWEGSLVNSDDSLYAEIAKQILKRGDWINLYWQDFQYFTKPPLYFWLLAISAKAFSLNEFALRLPCAISGLFLVVLVYSFAKRAGSTFSALICSGTLLSSAMFLNLSRRVMLEVPLALFISLSIWGFWRALENKKFLYLAYVSAGIAFLIKGYAFFPALMVPLIYYAITRNLKILLCRESLIGLVSMITILLPWQLYNFVTYGPEFTQRFIFGQVISHASGQGISYFNKPFLYYLSVLWDIERPVTALFILSIFIIIFRAMLAERKAILLFLLWVASCLAVYSFSTAKISHYIFVIIPPSALLIGTVIGSLKYCQKAIYKVMILAVISVMGFINFYPYLDTNSWYVDSSAKIKTLVGRYNAIAPKDSTLYLLKIYIASSVFYSNTKVIGVEPDNNVFKIQNQVAEFNSQKMLLNIGTEEFWERSNSRNDFFAIVQLTDFKNYHNNSGKVKIEAQAGDYVLVSNLGG